MKHNFYVGARHVPGVYNENAEALSRVQGSRPQGGEHPLYQPAFSTDSLKEEVLHYASCGLAWSINRTYTAGEKCFLQFCLMIRLISPSGNILPASEGTLIYFATYLARTVKHSTIKLYLAAVHNLHISCGHGDPLLGNLLLQKALWGILRYQGKTRIRIRLPTSYPLGFTGYTAYFKTVVR